MGVVLLTFILSLGIPFLLLVIWVFNHDLSFGYFLIRFIVAGEVVLTLAIFLFLMHKDLLILFSSWLLLLLGLLSWVVDHMRIIH